MNFEINVRSRSSETGYHVTFPMWFCLSHHKLSSWKLKLPTKKSNLTDLKTQLIRVATIRILGTEKNS